MSNEELDDLDPFVDSKVTIKLKNGIVLEGVLAGYDQHMNIVLEEEQNTTVLRGHNIVDIQK